MDFIYVDSTTVDQIAYDEAASEAHVIFKNNGQYIYSDVSQEVWERFRDSESKGRFIHQEFTAKGYNYRKV